MKKNKSFVVFCLGLRCGYVISIASIVLTCSFLAAVSILGFFVSYFKQMVRRVILVILIHDDIKRQESQKQKKKKRSGDISAGEAIQRQGLSKAIFL